RQTHPSFLDPVGTATLITVPLRGAVTGLKPGDALLVVCGAAMRPYTVIAVDADAAADRTLATCLLFGAVMATPPPSPAPTTGTGTGTGTGTTTPPVAVGVTQPASTVSAEGGSVAFTPTTTNTASSVPPLAPLARLAKVVQALQCGPSRPPATRFHLPRETATTFHGSADLGPQLLTQFNPDLKHTLYTAYGNAPVTGHEVPECGVEALRAKAALFGATAPLELVFNDNVPAGRREWGQMEFGGTARVRLTSIQTNTGVSAAFGRRVDLATEATPLRLEVTLEEAPGVTRFTGSFMVREIAGPGRGTFGQPDPTFFITDNVPGSGQALRITLAFAGQPASGGTRYDGAQLRAVEVAFTLWPGRQTTIRITGEDDGNSSFTGLLQVAVDGDPLRNAYPDVSVTETVGSRTVTISHSSAPTGALEVDHRTPLLASEAQLRTVSLDASYDKIVPGSRVIVERPGAPALTAMVQQVRTVARADYGVSARVTQLVLDRRWLGSGTDALNLALDPRTTLAPLRAVTVHAQSEVAELAEQVIATDVSGNSIELDGLYDGLEAGRWLVVTGERTDVRDQAGFIVPGVRASELVMLAGVAHEVRLVQDARGELRELPGDTLHTVLLLSASLAYSYRRSTVTINANVVRATHGETRREVLGSGDGAQPFQRFALKQKPLTWLAAATPSGVRGTLEVRVDGVRWPLAGSLLDLGGNARGYVLRTDDDGTTRVTFGDGRRGARLPTGVENVTAVYRTGIGKGGNVEAGLISVLASRPLGVRDVVNPRRATGGADPETRDQARRNVPIAVLALDRLVSVSDYADFARTFAGIGKAAATALTDGRRQVVHLTIAGADDIPIDPSSDLYAALLAALRGYGDPVAALQLAVREAVFLFLAARVRVHPDHLWTRVEPALRAALLLELGFDRRELGEDVLLSRVVSVMQAVPGVEYVDVDLLDGISESQAADPEALAQKLDELGSARAGGTSGCAARPRARLTVHMARVDATDPARRILPAQMAWLNPALPDTLVLTEVTT
ncbi:MAG TPA: putative baseplate assembly protein, partial [Longimicrobium sp.]|nr:putative baseplate assembly protein [Longimicrobium sp.]